MRPARRERGDRGVWSRVAERRKAGPRRMSPGAGRVVPDVTLDQVASTDQGPMPPCVRYGVMCDG